MNATLVDIRLLNVRFRPEGAAEVIAVKDFSWRILKGEFLALAGESGSGKSVSALSVAGLLGGAASGSIRWNGTDGPLDLDSCGPETLRKIRGRRIAYVFQDPASAFSPVERIGPQIERVRAAHFAELKAVSAERVMAALLEVGFTDPKRIAFAYPHELSGGMRQRAAIASALVAEPELLIADEPTTSLDPLSEMEIMRLLEAVRRGRGLSVLFITHDLALASAFAEKIYVLRRGEKIEEMYRGVEGFKSHTSYGRALLAAQIGKQAPKTLLEVPRAL